MARALADDRLAAARPGDGRRQGRDGLGNFRKLLHIVRGGASSSATTTGSSATKVAWVLCGGDVDPGTVVDEQYLLDLERTAFLKVCRTPKTMERLPGHAHHRQTAAQLATRKERTDEGSSDRQSAVRTPVGKAPKGMLPHRPSGGPWP